MTPEEIERSFGDQIAPDLFAGAQARPHPRCILIGGQPGAGKSRATDYLLDLYPDHDIIPIIGDDFRRYHHDYVRTLSQDPTRMPEVTAAAAGKWTEMAVNAGLAQGLSVLIEGTWRNQEVPLASACRAQQQGYDVHAVVVAVPAAVSLIATLTRFYDADPSLARWTPVQAHDDTVAVLPDTVAALAGSELIDLFTVLDRDGTVHFDETADDLTYRTGQAARTYRDLVDRDLTEHELASIIKDVARLPSEHQHRTLAAPAAIAAWNRVCDELGHLQDAAPALTPLLAHIKSLAGTETVPTSNP